MIYLRRNDIMKRKLIIATLMITTCGLVACGNPANQGNDKADGAPEEITIDVNWDTDWDNDVTVNVDGEDVPEEMEGLPEYRDYSGVYNTGDEENTISFNQNGDGLYDVNFSVFRLCNMDGSGNWVDGAVEISLIDPSGSNMSAIFYPNGDDTYTLKITQSTWAHIEEGAEFGPFSFTGAADASVGMGNPFVDIPAAEMAPMVGAYMNVPEGAEDVVYRVNTVENFGEIDFRLDGLYYTARVKMTADFEDIAGLYYEWDVEDDVEISWCKGKTCRSIQDDMMVDKCIWFDAVPGISYSLSTSAADLAGFDITAIASQVFVPMQGDN